MSLLNLTQASLAFGHVALLDKVDFSLETRERVGLIGRNGTGKSSMLKILAGMEQADDGQVQTQKGVRMAYVAQEPLFTDGVSIFDAVSEGLQEVRTLRARFEAHAEGDDLDAMMTQIDAMDGWNWEQRVDATLQRLNLNADTIVSTLSGGMRKRVALAQALVLSPDVLMLDEPTNHLDLQAIIWLQDLLKDYKGSVVMISHDRAFLDATCTRIIELDRGKLRSYPGNFAAYEQLKAQQLADEALANARQDKLLAQEEVWVRKGVEARRTRSVSRIKRLEALRDTRANRRDVVGKSKLALDQGDRGGKIVAELDNVSHGFGDLRIVDNFSTTILRGDKIGLVGGNGAGKTTLLKMMLGELQPDSGEVRQGTRLQIAYFDQMRDKLDLDATLADFISPGSEWVEINGTRKHVMGYLADFLFAPQRANSPIRTLSGGERNRLLLARLFARPANVLVLDEPTNDLDIDTLDLLEELLQDYPGTVFLVSHDRRFLDNVVTSLLVHEGPGAWREYEGGIEDWLVQSARSQRLKPEAVNVPEAPAADTNTSAPTPLTAPRKLSFKEQRELADIPAKIETLEVEQKTLQAAMLDPDIYKSDPLKIPVLQARHDEIDLLLANLLERWEQLS